MYIFETPIDKVPYKKLIKKLEGWEIEGNVLRWIPAWLEDRKQQV